MTLSNYLGENRSNAIWRLSFLVINILTVGIPLIIVTLIGAFGALSMMLGDILRRLVIDDPAPGDDRISGMIMWPADMLGWMIFGDRPFPWLPNF